MSGARRFHGNFTSVCKFCGKEFASKKRDVTVCYEDPCRRQYESARMRARYEKKLAQKVQSEGSGETECGA